MPVAQPAAQTPDRSGGLALVRLRLRLALVTLAVVPVAISLAFVFAIIDSQGLDVRVRVQGQSAALAAVIGAGLERSEGVLLVLAADPSLDEALRARSTDAAVAEVRSRLAAALGVSGPAVRGLLLLDEGGRILAGVGDQVGAATPSLPVTIRDEIQAALDLGRGAAHRSAPWVGADGEAWVTILSPVSGAAGRSIGVAAASLSLRALLEGAASGFDPSGARFILADPGSGTVLAEGDEAAAEPGADDLAAAVVTTGGAGQVQTREGWAVGVATIPLAAGTKLAAVVVDPTATTGFPVPLVSLLIGLAMLVVALAIWMARQVLRPAEELESSRRYLRQMYDAAREDSLRDGLTGLGNHRAFQEELDRQVEWYRRYRVPLSLLVIDLDDLKLVNDSEGHAAGDELLRRMGGLVSDVLRYSDRAFRIGGDEFAILMPHTDRQGALGVARRLLERALHPADGERLVPFSGGVSSCPELATSRAQLYAQADSALYWCKRHGRCSVDVYDPRRDRRTDQNISEEQAADVARVAAARQLRAVFQPIIDLRDGRVLGFEGLIRPTESAPFPDAGSLFTAAEAVGRTVELDAACFDVVATAARAIRPDQILSINLSPRTVEAPDFSAASILGVLAYHGIDPRRLILELTERETVQDVARLRDNLAELQAVGIRIAADDVGAGNAGLRLLSQVRFDIVKIDLSLVQEGAQRASSRAVLRSLRDLAGRWGAFVVAEGIETSEQLKVVRELGVSAGQGYLLGRPGPSVDVRRIDLVGLEAGHLMLQNAPPRPDAEAEAASSLRLPAMDGSHPASETAATPRRSQPGVASDGRAPYPGPRPGLPTSGREIAAPNTG